MNSRPKIKARGVPNIYHYNDGVVFKKLNVAQVKMLYATALLSHIEIQLRYYVTNTSRSHFAKLWFHQDCFISRRLWVAVTITHLAWIALPALLENVYYPKGHSSILIWWTRNQARLLISGNGFHKESAVWRYVFGWYLLVSHKCFFRLTMCLISHR
jgi:hypothetical protein